MNSDVGKQTEVNWSNLTFVQCENPEDCCRSPPVNLRFALVNTQSLRNKTSDFLDYCIESEVDSSAITETWFKQSDDEYRAKLKPKDTISKIT